MTFGQRLKELRLENDLTQEQLAKKVNLSKANISKYEADSVEPNLETLGLLSALFLVSVDYLLGLTEERTEVLSHASQNNRKKIPSPQGQGDKIIREALQGTGLLDSNGVLTSDGERVISDFLARNADLLKKLIHEE